MKNMLLRHIDERILSETKREECHSESAQLTHQSKSLGHYLAATPLYPRSTATEPTPLTSIPDNDNR